MHPSCVSLCFRFVSCETFRSYFITTNRHWRFFPQCFRCAFPNTPKYTQVRAAGGRIVKKEWIADCLSNKRMMPWRLYMLKPDVSSSADLDGEFFISLRFLLTILSKTVVVFQIDEEMVEDEKFNEDEEWGEYFSSSYLFFIPWSFFILFVLLSFFDLFCKNCSFFHVFFVFFHFSLIFLFHC